MRILSVDIGLDGGIAAWNNGHFIYADSMPIKKIETKPKRMVFNLDSKGKKQYYKTGSNIGKPKMKMKSPAKYRRELDVFTIDDFFFYADIIIIEDQGTSFGNSAQSTRTTARNFGKLLATAELSGAKVVIVAANTWKTHFKLNLTAAEKKKLTPKEYKNLSIPVAYELSKFKTKKDGIADAICILYWYIQTQGY